MKQPFFKEEDELEKELEQLNTERRQLEFHIERTGRRLVASPVMPVFSI